VTGHQYFILGADGEPQPVDDVTTWARWFEEASRDDAAGRRVARTNVDGVEVSTVFLGVNHDFGHHGLPMLFETMIFGGQWDQHQWRYSLRTEAQRGHDTIVAALRAGVKPDDPA
jgi:hypothetical protein